MAISYTRSDKPLIQNEKKILDQWEKYYKPLVSINCITYNHEKYIKDALDGFLIQKTDFPFEILVHDDASTDGTADIIREYEKQYPNIIKPIYQSVNQHSQGQKCSLFNFERAQGEYFAYCEGDDYWTDSFKLQKQVEFLNTHSDYGLIFTDADVLYEDTGKIIKGYDKTYKNKIPQGNVLGILLYGNPYKTCTSLFRKKYFTESINIIENNKFKMGDFVWWLCIASKTKVKYLSDSTSVYRILKESASHYTCVDQAVAYSISGYDVSLYFASLYGIDVDKKRLKKKLQKDIIQYCVNNNFLYLRKYINHPFLILKMIAKEKIARPLFVNYINTLQALTESTS